MATMPTVNKFGQIIGSLSIALSNIVMKNKNNAIKFTSVYLVFTIIHIEYLILANIDFLHLNILHFHENSPATEAWFL